MQWTSYEKFWYGNYSNNSGWSIPYIVFYYSLRGQCTVSAFNGISRQDGDVNCVVDKDHGVLSVYAFHRVLKFIWGLFWRGSRTDKHLAIFLEYIILETLGF